jgi:flagellar hook assembly protein FlgD
VSLSVFDVTGRMIRLIQPHTLRAAGRHDATWDGRDDAAREVASGTYVIKLETDEGTVTRKVVRSR